MTDMHRSTVFEPSGKRVGDYQLGQLLGIGGMGSVYLARQISLNRLVALKILHFDLAFDDASLNRFFREMRLSAKLTTDGVARVYEAGRDGDVIYFSMEYVDGNNLNALLRFQQHPFTEDETLEIALFIARTMSYAWKQYQIVHRDIKPANILRTISGEYKLLDLGVSKSFHNNGITSTDITTEKFMIGSPAYMSPEQARDITLDCRADIYSLGITMYQLLTGKVPYDSPSQFEVVAMHIKSPVPNVREAREDVSRRTADLICDMLAKEPADRPEDWDVLYLRIKKIITWRNFFARFSWSQNKKFQIRFLFAAAVMLCVVITILATAIPGPQTGNSKDVRSGAAVAAEVDADRIPAMREEALRSLLQQSGNFERQKDYRSALALWRHYTPPEELRNDSVLLTRIKEQIQYLQEQLRQQNEEESAFTAE